MYRQNDQQPDREPVLQRHDSGKDFVLCVDGIATGTADLTPHH